MKKVIKNVFVILMLIMCFGLTGCTGYASHFKAFVLVTQETSNASSMSFSTIEGQKSFKMKCKASGEKLKYYGKLEKGNATVYYDNDGTKKELFKIGEGETVESTLEGLEKGKIYVIVETDGKCENGSFKFEIE